MFFAILAGFAGAVEEEDDRGGFAGGIVVGDENDVFGFFAIGVFVDAVEKASFDFVGGAGV